MTNTIYTSEKVMPYVYWGTHKVTGQFYIGYRCANKNPANIDLGTHYFTSSRKVKELGFENFDWIILAEFFNAETRKTDSYEFEQDLIEIHIAHPLNLNGYQGRNRQWNTIGQTGKNPYKNRSEEENKLTSERMTKSQVIRFQNQTEETRLANNKKRLETFQNRTDEQKASTQVKRAERFENRTEEEKIQYSQNMSVALQNRSPEDKATSLAQRTETVVSKSDEEKAKTRNKKSETWANRSDNEKMSTKQKRLDKWENKSDEERQQIINVRTESNTKLSVQQRKEFVDLRNSGMAYKDLRLWVLSLDIELTIDAVRKMYHREMKKSQD